jgi:hypothetical protein
VFDGLLVTVQRCAAAAVDTGPGLVDLVDVAVLVLNKAEVDAHLAQARGHAVLPVAASAPTVPHRKIDLWAR